MVKTYCDACKQEIQSNAIVSPLKLYLRDERGPANLYAEVTFSMDSDNKHLCLNCALQVVRQGEVVGT